MNGEIQQLMLLSTDHNYKIHLTISKYENNKGFRVWGLGLTIREYLSLPLFFHPQSKVFDRFR